MFHKLCLSVLDWGWLLLLSLCHHLWMFWLHHWHYHWGKWHRHPEPDMSWSLWKIRRGIPLQPMCWLRVLPELGWRDQGPVRGAWSQTREHGSCKPEESCLWGKKKVEDFICQNANITWNLRVNCLEVQTTPFLMVIVPHLGHTLPHKTDEHVSRSSFQIISFPYFIISWSHS